MSKDNIRDHWNLTALEYQKKRHISYNDIEYAEGYAKESELNLLGDVKGKKVIELGCGGAENSIILAKQGAKCTGVDLSIEQLKYARNSAEKHGVDIELIEGDFENLFMLGNKCFDIAISIFAIDWAQDLKAAFKEAYRILKDKGIFVFSMQHPTWNLLGENPTELKITENYFKEVWEGEESTGIPVKVHASKISDIINELIDIGFNIERMLEPPSDVIKIVPSTIIFKVIKRS